MRSRGIVYIVGAGPGRPDLITIRGVDLIRMADCIIADRLASQGLLVHARSDVEVIYTPKGIGQASIAQSRINELMIQKALEGKVVVRLKGGDPTVFARTAEELAALSAANIPFEIVPGVTAATGAAAYTGIMLTDRDVASQVVFATGHQAEGKQASPVDWRHLASFHGTIVLYMAARNLETIASELMANGMPGTTPAAVVADATLPTQRTIRACLAELARRCTQDGIEPPIIVIIGHVAAADRRLDWFGSLPLFGRTIVTTRDHRGNAELAGMIEALGGQAICIDTIRLRPLPVLGTIAKLRSYDWVAFTSRWAVEFFFEQLQAMGMDSRSLGNAMIAAIGPATAKALARFGIKADLVPETYTSMALGRAMIEATEQRGKRILLIRSELADNQLQEALEAAGAAVDQVAAYTSEPLKAQTEPVLEMLKSGRISWIAFASSSEATVFLGQVDPGIVNANTRIVSIGPQTSATLARLGLRVDLEARKHTTEGIIDAILEAGT